MKLLFAESLLNLLTRLFVLFRFWGPRAVGGLYSFNLAGEPVDVHLNNETSSCSEIKRVASFKI